MIDFIIELNDAVATAAKRPLSHRTSQSLFRADVQIGSLTSSPRGNHSSLPAQVKQRVFGRCTTCWATVHIQEAKTKTNQLVVPRPQVCKTSRLIRKKSKQTDQSYAKCTAEQSGSSQLVGRKMLGISSTPVLPQVHTPSCAGKTCYCKYFFKDEHLTHIVATVLGVTFTCSGSTGSLSVSNVNILKQDTGVVQDLVVQQVQDVLNKNQEFQTPPSSHILH